MTRSSNWNFVCAHMGDEFLRGLDRRPDIENVSEERLKWIDSVMADGGIKLNGHQAMCECAEHGCAG